MEAPIPVLPGFETMRLPPPLGGWRDFTPSDKNIVFVRELSSVIEKQLIQLKALIFEGILTTAESVVDTAQSGTPFEEASAAKLRPMSLAPLGKAVFNVARSSTEACKIGDIQTAYILARSAVEGAINLLYLSLCAEAEFRRWRDYSLQKEFQLLQRTYKAGNAEFSFGTTAMPNLVLFPDLAQAVRQFTGKKGGKKTEYTSTPLLKRLEAVGDKTKNSRLFLGLLLLAYASVYEVGSEAAHGTYLGDTLDLKSPLGQEQLGSHLCSHLCVVLMANSFSLGGAIAALAHVYGREQRIQEIIDEGFKVLGRIEAQIGPAGA